MIRLIRSAKPIELTPQLQADLTAEYKTTKKSVWNIDFLKDALRSYSSEKCCYCEANINEESKYLEVEHFHPKTPYEDEIMEWENLLPSCKKCNGTKGDHDTKKEPIIDPTNDYPNKHLKFWNFRLKGTDSLGELTVSTLNLNEQDRLVIKRFEIGNAIHEKLEDIQDWLNDVITGTQTSTLRKNRIKNGIKALLREALPSAEYSATAATVILTSQDYHKLKGDLESQKLWDDEMGALEKEISFAAFELYKRA